MSSFIKACLRLSTYSTRRNTLFVRCNANVFGAARMQSTSPIKRVRFGTIGTSIITENFIAAGEQVAGFELVAVYSRSLDQGKEFVAKVGKIDCMVFNDVYDMARSADVDAVYVASPVSEHARHCIICMEHGKHVLCEKVVCSNSRELDAVLACAKSHGVAFMEAMRTLHSPNFTVFRNQIESLGRVRHFVGTACQLSSKWPAYLRGERPNIFSIELSNGALMDIGCYAIHTAVALFGLPSRLTYKAVMLENGADGGGTLVLEYEDKVATLLISKFSQGFARSEVQTENGTISVDSLLEFTDVILHDTKDGTLISQSQTGSGDIDLRSRGAMRWSRQMVYEVRAFIAVVVNGTVQDPVVSWSHCKEVMQLLDEARSQAGIVFQADRQETSEEVRRWANHLEKTSRL